MTTIKSKLLAIQEGQYTVYVFENLNEEETSEFKYVTCTKLPNGQYTDKIEIGDIGYLQYDNVLAGNQYFHSSSGSYLHYKYTNCYFINFIKSKEDIIINKEFKF